jgi:nucleolar GTP-binding protein
VDARRALRRLPSIDPELPTIVVAGYPNVGKSSFVRAVSTGRPAVADYPFTTKGVSLGHIERGIDRYQILDTPGILDRPMEKRNKMERQAIAALSHVADAVLFLMDPTETCGYSLDEQVRLLGEVEGLFPEVPIVVAENKADLDAPASSRLRISSLTGEGVPATLELLLEKLTSRGPAGAIRPEVP